MSVNILDARTVSQIAAGEVVENPASVIKELLENSLDAGARRIKVMLQKGGLEEITVLDDGCGIPAVELRLALKRHATSKIKTIDDLELVNTLGFRGEALPSIAAVSRISLTTRQENEETGSFIYLEGGEENDFKAAGFPRGTMVTVKDLFFNVPVRRKFLRSVAAESAQATRTIELLALSHPHISFTLERDGKVCLETPGDGSLLNTVLQIFGHNLAPHLLPVHFEQDNYELEGYVSAPTLSLKSRSHQLFFVNRRNVRNRLFREALEKSFSRFVTARRYPLAFLFLSLSPKELDVNVHPAKIEVRFRQESKLFDFLCKGITEGYNGQQNKSFVQKKKEEEKGSNTKTFRSDMQGQEQNLVFQLNFEEDICVRERATELPQVHPETLHKDTSVLTSERIILSQLFASFILLQQNDKFLLVDQHAAHERILWEECLRRRTGEKQYMQEVLPFPQELTLSPAKDYISEERVKLMAELGLELEQFGNTSFIVRAVPFFLKDIFTAQMLSDVLQELASDSSLAKPDWQEAFLMQLMCKAAVKANKQLTMEEMEGLLNQLEQCQNPDYCPHGRPIIIQFTRKELEKIFHRR